MKSKFAWVSSARGEPEPQIWNRGEITKDLKPVKPLQAHDIEDHEVALGIDALALRYPFVQVGGKTPRKQRFPKVNLIDYTGAGEEDFLWAARLLVYTKSTRLTQGMDTRRKIFHEMPEEQVHKELEYIANTLRSSWEFVDFTFEIQNVTRAFTHQLVRTRTASYAQQAQRVVDMSDFDNTIPITVLETEKRQGIWDRVMAAISAGYTELQADGVPNQDCRGLLPTNVQTNIIMKCNLRTLADLCGKRINLRAQGEYETVMLAMRAAVYGVMPWTKPFLEPTRTATPMLDKILRRLLGNASPIDMPELNGALKEVDNLKGIWG